MELAVSAEGRHPKLVDGKVHELIRYGEAKSGGAAK
jgi:hypothetical protein